MAENKNGWLILANPPSQDVLKAKRISLDYVPKQIKL